MQAFRFPWTCSRTGTISSGNHSWPPTIWMLLQQKRTSCNGLSKRFSHQNQVLLFCVLCAQHCVPCTHKCVQCTQCVQTTHFLTTVLLFIQGKVWPGNSSNSTWSATSSITSFCLAGSRTVHAKLGNTTTSSTSSFSEGLPTTMKIGQSRSSTSMQRNRHFRTSSEK